MALKWIIGDFRNGAISESNELPVVYNEGDKVEIDVNANESATITVSKNDLPSDWRTYLRPVDRFVALIETDLAWASSVIWAGFINKASARVNETVQIQATGLREYMAARIVSNTYNTTNANPEAAVVFQSGHIRGMMANMILACFSSSGIPSSSPKPPQVLSSVTGSASGTTVSHSVLLSDFQNYGNMLDEWRDELSDGGQEYRFTPSWSSSSKTAIRWIGEVASTHTPHFNEENTLNIVLGDNAWKPIAYGQSASSDNMISRIIGQSKEGAGTDYTTKTTTSSTSVLLDETFNPGIELTSTQLNAQLTERLNYNSQSFKEADFSRVYETTAELRTIISQLGSMTTFSGSGASQYFGLTMRIVGVSFNPSKKTVELQLAPKAARYPKLPKDNRGLKKKSETKHYKPKSPDYGNYTRPISPQPKPGSNGTDIPGGGGPTVPPNPFTPPVNDRDIYEEEEPVIENVDKRWFKTEKMLFDETPTDDWYDYWHPYPHPSRSRFNDNTGEFIGINLATQKVYDDAYYEILEDKTAGHKQKLYGVQVWSIDIPGMFDRDSNPYKSMIVGSVGNSTDVADNYKYKIGEIPLSMYEDLIMPIDDFKATIPTEPGTSVRSHINSAFDYSFFCTEDFKTVYVQIMFTVSCSWTESSPTRKISHCSTLSKVIKGVRDENGIVQNWESLGQALVENPGTENARTFFSPNIYEIDGKFQSFGGFLIPIAEELLDVSALFDKSSSNVYEFGSREYQRKFYTQNYYADINPETDFIDNSTEYELPQFQKIKTGQNNLYYVKNTLVMLGTTVDYKNKKIVIGCTQESNDKDHSVFYESSFSQKTNFKKVLDTKRETSAMYEGYKYSTIFCITSEGSSTPMTDGSYTSLSTSAVVKHLDNYLFINPLGRNGYGTSYYDPYYEEWIMGRTKESALNYLRSKQGFNDVVSGGIKMEDLALWNSSAFASRASVDQASRFIRHSKNMGYNLAAFHNNHAISNRNLGSDLSDFVNSGGFMCFVYNDILYTVNSLRFFDLGVGSTSSAEAMNNRFNYWVGKFRFKDNLL